MKRTGLSRLWMPPLRALGVAALAGSLLGGMAAPPTALAAAPATDYTLIATGTSATSTISAADDTASGASSCTLRDALGIVNTGTLPPGPVHGCQITQFGSGGPYVIRLPKGAYTYTLTEANNELSISNNSVYILGASPTSTIIQTAITDATPGYRVFALATPGFVDIENLTIRNGECKNDCIGVTDGGSGLLITAGALTLNNVRFNTNMAGGDGGGAMRISGATVNIVKSTFTGNEADDGGAIGIYANSNVTVDGSTFVDNAASASSGAGGGINTFGSNITLRIIHGSKFTRTPTGPATAALYGGGVSIQNADAVLDGSSITGLSATAGGGVYVSGGGTLTIQAKSLISGNTATNGGGIYLDTAGGGGTAVIDGSTVTKNKSATRGGGAYNGGGTLTLQHGAFITANTAATLGGGIYNVGTTTITGKSQIAKNVAVSGGGIQNNMGSTTINGGSLVTGNSADLSSGCGGGLAGNGFDLDSMTISKNKASCGGGISGQFDAHQIVISGNTAIEDGGGISVGMASSLDASTVSGNVAQTGYGGGGFSSNSLTVTNSTFSGNKAPLSVGGGLRVGSGGVAYLNNSTFYGNSANYGGGLWVDNSTVGLYNTTITKNKATVDGGGLFVEATGATITYTDSIISGNTAPANADCSAAAISAGYNLVGATCDHSQAGDISPGVPKLGPLAKNGGPTMTVALLTGSSAIDAGNNVSGCQDNTATTLDTDQRGYLRSWGAACDMGAFEAQPKPPALSLPKAGAAVSKLKFSWKYDPATTTETLTIGQNSDCTGAVLIYTPLQLIKGVTIPLISAPDYDFYYWCVQARASGPTDLALGEIRPFEYTFALKPVNKAYAKQGKVKFSWLKLFDPANPSSPATGYDLLISDFPDCGAADVTSVTKTSATVSLLPGIHYWQARAFFSSSNVTSTCRQLNVTY